MMLGGDQLFQVAEEHPMTAAVVEEFASRGHAVASQIINSWLCAGGLGAKE